MSIATRVRAATRDLCSDVSGLRFAAPVSFVYNPLEYASRPHATYVKRFGDSAKRVLFLGMNPGPFGMAQTGVPFGEVKAVRGWLGIEAPVKRPPRVHPKRPIQGFDCTRSEVSGERLWGTIAKHFGKPERFFERHYIANYCPLIFLEEGGRNRTPDKLPRSERDPLFSACDRYLRRMTRAFEAEWVIGIGNFAATRAEEALGESGVRIGRVLHPSPANPRANRDWAGEVEQQLGELGLCSSKRRRS